MTGRAYPSSLALCEADPAEFIVRRAYVISVDPEIGEVPQGDIHVRDGRIVAVGSDLDAPGAAIINGKDLIALPGFIDTHWHMWGAVARNMAGHEDGSGYYFVSRLLGKFFQPEDNARGVMLALAEGINSGITTFTNWSHNLLSTDYAVAEIEAHRAAGARARFAYGYSRKTPPNTPLPLGDIESIRQQYFRNDNLSDDGLMSMAIAPRGPESNDIDICRTEWSFARERNLRITCHMGTSAARVLKRQGVRALAEAGLLGPDVILIHDTNTSDEDIALLARTRTPVSLSPYTEMRTGFGYPPVLRFLAAGVPLCLSVDTTILCGNADMFAIMKAIQNVACATVPSEFAIASERIIQMATLDGARALGIDQQVGSLTPGKRADFLLVRTEDVNMMPFSVASRMIVQSAQPSNINAVVVNGKFLKKNGVLTTIDLQALRVDVADTISRARHQADQPGADGGILRVLSSRD